jgi:hypothetical protein
MTNVEVIAESAEMLLWEVGDVLRSRTHRGSLYMIVHHEQNTRPYCMVTVADHYKSNIGSVLFTADTLEELQKKHYTGMEKVNSIAITIKNQEG